jgi:hypothetical protein
MPSHIGQIVIYLVKENNMFRYFEDEPITDVEEEELEEEGFEE